MFSADVMSTIEAGTSLVVGTVGVDGEPRATRALALIVVDGPIGLVRVVMGADDPIMVEQLRTGRIAVTAADVRTLRSVQLKGRIVRVGPPSAADERDADEHIELFFAAIHEIDGFDPAVARKMRPIDLLSVEFVVEELYDQSPGPSAGRSMALA